MTKVIGLGLPLRFQILDATLYSGFILGFFGAMH